MTRAQANALMVALAGQKLNADAQMRFDPAGAEGWNVQLDPDGTYTGAQIAQLQNYCNQQGLSLTLALKQMGVT